MSTNDTDVNRTVEAERRHAIELELEGQREPRVIEQRIDATRADMRATLEALERRFSFERLMDLTVGRIREHGGEFAGNLTHAATQNPVPLVLASIGLGWLMLTSRPRVREGDSAQRHVTRGSRMAGAQARAAHASDKVQGAVDSTRDTLGHAAESSHAAMKKAAEASRETYEHAADSLHHAAESLRDGVGTAAAATREQLDHARTRMHRLLDEQPLMLGALGIAAGAIIGALLPTTEHEDRLLGEARDKAVRDAAKRSRERFEAAREHAATRAAPGAGGTADTGPHDRPASRPH